MTSKIIGRKEELKILDQIYKTKEPQFLAIYGRRRIGKTHLISEYFKTKGVYFELTGIRKGAYDQQLKEFAISFGETFKKGSMINPPGNWQDAFHLLGQKIKKIQNNQKIIIFIDELPWLNTKRSNLISFLGMFWNKYASKRSNTIVVICGSAASWIIDNVIADKGGLHDRINQIIQLKPFTLKEVEQFLKYRQVKLIRKQIIELYMAFGGVAEYLKHVQPGESPAQTISRVCFSHNSFLFKEFNRLYESLFDNHHHHIHVVKSLFKQKKGMTRNEIIKRTKLTSGDTLNKVLRELTESNFIIKQINYGKKVNNAIYRLNDEYSIFYLSWIDELPALFNDPNYWVTRTQNVNWKIWSGLAFESICIKHIQEIKNALNIGAVLSYQYAWRYVATNKDEKGTQIDLIIDRNDNCINLCELKFYNQVAVIDKSYKNNLENKIQIFCEKNKIKNKSIFLTFISPYGVKKNQYYNATVTNQITIDALFE